MKISNCDWLEKLYKNINTNKLPQSVIINGQKGVGKKLLSKRIALDLLNTKNLNSSEVTLNLFKKNNHPDFYVLDKEKILINDISRREGSWDEEKGKKDIISFISLTPSLSNHKVALILNAESMNQSAQNALLKTLEEPSNNSFIIMTTNRSRSLNKTIYSRSQVINIHAPSDDIVNKWLKQNHVDDYSSVDFPSFYAPFTILDSIESGNHDIFKEFIEITINFIIKNYNLNIAIKQISELDLPFINKLNFLIEFLKIILYSKTTNKAFNGKYKIFNKLSYSTLKLSNIIEEINNLRNNVYEVGSINEAHALNYFYSEIGYSFKQL